MLRKQLRQHSVTRDPRTPQSEMMKIGRISAGPGPPSIGGLTDIPARPHIMPAEETGQAADGEKTLRQTGGQKGLEEENIWYWACMHAYSTQGARTECGGLQHYTFHHDTFHNKSILPTKFSPF